MPRESTALLHGYLKRQFFKCVIFFLAKQIKGKWKNMINLLLTFDSKFAFCILLQTRFGPILTLIIVLLVFDRIHTPTHPPTHTHTPTHTYIHTYTHTYTRTHTHSHFASDMNLTLKLLL